MSDADLRDETAGDSQEPHPLHHPEHFKTAYSEVPTHELDPTTELGDPAHHPEHFKTAYSENAPEEFDPVVELGEHDED